MSFDFLVPSDRSLKNSLTMIYGEEPEVVELPVAEVDQHYVASYADADGSVVALCCCDLSAAASLACALSLIPIPTCEEMIATSTLSAIAQENLYEVMNICSALLMNDHSGHLRLLDVQAVSASGLADSTSIMQSAGFFVSNTKYPDLKMAFYTS